MMETWRGYDTWKTTDPRENDGHYKACPCHEDAPEVYSACGGEGECLRSKQDCEDGECHIVEPECECKEIREDDLEARAEAKREEY